MDVLAAHAQRAPDALALIEGERRLTWRAFVDRRNRHPDHTGARIADLAELPAVLGVG